MSNVVNLNKRQQEAVEYVDGPLEVVAGPGTGKTRVITEKVVHLTTRLGHAPDSILALTFTEKAAEEMGGRIRAALAAANVKGQPTVSTFHAFCLDLIEEHAHRLGYDRDPSLLVGPLYTQFIAENVDALVTTHTDLVGKVNKFASDLAKFVSLCHDERLIGTSLTEAVQEWIATEVHAKDEAAAKKVLDLAASVPALLELQRTRNIVTYGDLVTGAVRLLEENEDILAEVRARYSYVLVDEYQDNNRAQSDLVRLLAAAHRKVCVVGDEDQSIYRFRGARSGIMQAFLDEWEAPGAKQPKVVTLDENYRSTDAIIAAGQALIKNNPDRAADKRLERAETSRAEGPPQARLAVADSEATERAFIQQEIRRLVREGRAEGDIAILVRSLNHAAALVNDLRFAGVGVEVVGGGGLFSNAAVREVLAWLKALDNPEGDEAALHRLLLMQGFGITHEDQRTLGRRARDLKLSLATLIERSLETPVAGVSEAGHSRLQGFLALRQRFIDEARPQGRPDVTGLILEILDMTGIGRRLRPDDADGRQGLAAVGGLLQAAENYQEHFPYPSLHGFVRHLDLLEELGHDETVGEMSDDPATVKVMTVHKSKGKEFPVVIIPSLERYPPKNSRGWDRKFLDHFLLEDADIKAVHEQEERRVLFVAMTRAESELLLTTARTHGDGKPAAPSSFEEEVRECALVVAKEVAAGDLEPPGAAGDAYRTRRQMENRLSFLVSRLGTRAEGHDVEAALKESVSLVAGLLADGAAGGVEAVERVLTKFNIPVPVEVRHLEPDKPKGITGPLYLSASSLNLYEKCPRQFYYKQVVRIPESSTFEARLGTAIHDALEQFHKRHAEPAPAHLDELLALFAEKVSEVQFQSESEKEQALERGRDMLALYLEEEHARGVHVMEVEKEFRVTLGDDVVLSGKIDRLDRLPDGSVRVVDYKTGKLGSRPDYLNEFQMPIYAWAVQEELGHKLHAVEVIGLKELKDSAKGPKLNRQELPWEDGSRYALTQERLEGVKKDVEGIVLAIRAGKFDAKPEAQHCGWCRYRLLCDDAHGTTDGT